MPRTKHPSKPIAVALPPARDMHPEVPPRPWPWAGAALVAVPAMLAYLATLEPTVYYVDSGVFLATVKDFGVGYPPGFPLYIFAAKLWTLLTGFLPFARGLHAFSALAAAATAVVTFWSAFHLLMARPRLLGDAGGGDVRAGKPSRRREPAPPRRGRARPAPERPPAAADPGEQPPLPGMHRRGLAFVGAVTAGWLAAFGYTAWSQAINAAVFTFQALFASAVLYAALRLEQTGRVGANPTPEQRRLLLAMVAAWGLAWAVHYLSVGLVPFALWMIYRHRALLRNGKLVRQGVALFLLCGAAPYIYQPIRSATWPEVDWGHVAYLPNWIAHLTGANWTTDSSNFRLFAPGELARQIGHWGELTLFQFVPLSLVPILGGWYCLWRWYRPLFAPFLLFYLGATAVGLIYVTNNAESYLIPAHTLLALLAGVGVVHGVDAVERAARLSPRAGLAVAAAVALLLAGATLYRNYPELDRHDSYVMEDYGRNALAAVPEKGILLVPGDHLNASVLFLQVVLDHRREVAVIPESLAHFDWWRESFRHRTAGFHLPEIPVDRVPSEEEWMTRMVAGLLQGNPGRDLYMLTLKGRSLPEGYQAVPAGIGYRVLPGSDAAALEVRRSHWDFSFRSIEELTRPARSLQRAYNVGRREIQLAYFQAFQNLGDLDFDGGRHALAAESYAAGLRFVPDHPELLLGLGASLAKAGRAQEALAYLPAEQRRGLYVAGISEEQIQAAFGAAWKALAARSYSGGNLRRAVQGFRMAHALNPTDPEVLADLGGALASLGEPEEALAPLKEAIRLAPGNANAYFNLGQVYDTLNERALSQEMFQRAFALDPGLRGLLNR